MSKRKYKPMHIVHSLAEFEKCDAIWYEVVCGENKRMWHRGALESLQVHTLKIWLYKNYIYACKEINDVEQNS